MRCCCWCIAVLPLPIHDVYTRNLIIITVLFAGLAQAWNILGGYCGQISLSHALYFGVGAYVSTLLLTRAWAFRRHSACSPAVRWAG